MKTMTISATAARNNFFELLDQVIDEDIQVVITKAGSKKPVILSLSPELEVQKTSRIADLKETYGVLKSVSVSDVTDDRLRGKRARAYIKKVTADNA